MGKHTTANPLQVNALFHTGNLNPGDRVKNYRQTKTQLQVRAMTDTGNLNPGYTVKNYRHTRAQLKAKAMINTGNLNPGYKVKNVDKQQKASPLQNQSKDTHKKRDLGARRRNKSQATT